VVDHVVEIRLPSLPRRPLLLLLALLGLVAVAVLMAVAAFLLTARHSGHHVAASTSASRTLAGGQVGPTSPPGKPTLSRHQTSVLILNGNGVNGAAAAAARVVGHLGYRLRPVGNARRMDYPQSLVMFRPGLRPEAMRFAHDVGIKLVGPLDGMRAGAIRAKLVYVLGR
jgi:hypothetical protein